MLPKPSIHLTVNGKEYEAIAEERTTLADFLRDHLHLSGTRLGCEQGVCGACTVLLDGRSVRSCLLLAVQAQRARVMTIEGLAGPDGQLHPLQQAFSEEHGLQCGFCTPGFILSALELIVDERDPTENMIRSRLSGNLCRCTGYQNIVAAVRAAARRMRNYNGPRKGANTFPEWQQEAVRSGSEPAGLSAQGEEVGDGR